MPDEHDPTGTGRHSDPAPRRGRRRSMETDGGISVSDVVARHTGERPIFDSDPCAVPRNGTGPAVNGAPPGANGTHPGANGTVPGANGTGAPLPADGSGPGTNGSHAANGTTSPRGSGTSRAANGTGSHANGSRRAANGTSPLANGTSRTANGAGSGIDGPAPGANGSYNSDRETSGPLGSHSAAPGTNGTSFPLNGKNGTHSTDPRPRMAEPNSHHADPPPPASRHADPNASLPGSAHSTNSDGSLPSNGHFTGSEASLPGSAHFTDPRARMAEPSGRHADLPPAASRHAGPNASLPGSTHSTDSEAVQPDGYFTAQDPELADPGVSPAHPNADPGARLAEPGTHARTPRADIASDPRNAELGAHSAEHLAPPDPGGHRATNGHPANGAHRSPDLRGPDPAPGAHRSPGFRDPADLVPGRHVPDRLADPAPGHRGPDFTDGEVEPGFPESANNVDKAIGSPPRRNGAGRRRADGVGPEPGPAVEPDGADVAGPEFDPPAPGRRRNGSGMPPRPRRPQANGALPPEPRRPADAGLPSGLQYPGDEPPRPDGMPTAGPDEGRPPGRPQRSNVPPGPPQFNGRALPPQPGVGPLPHPDDQPSGPSYSHGGPPPGPQRRNALPPRPEAGHPNDGPRPPADQAGPIDGPPPGPQRPDLRPPGPPGLAARAPRPEPGQQSDGPYPSDQPLRSHDGPPPPGRPRSDARPPLPGPDQAGELAPGPALSTNDGLRRPDGAARRENGYGDGPFEPPAPDEMSTSDGGMRPTGRRGRRPMGHGRVPGAPQGADGASDLERTQISAALAPQSGPGPGGRPGDSEANRPALDGEQSEAERTRVSPAVRNGRKPRTGRRGAEQSRLNPAPNGEQTQLSPMVGGELTPGSPLPGREPAQAGRDQTQPNPMPGHDQTQMNPTPGREQTQASLAAGAEQTQLSPQTSREQARPAAQPNHERARPGPHPSREQIPTPGVEQTRLTPVPNAEQTRLTPVPDGENPAPDGAAAAADPDRTQFAPAVGLPGKRRPARRPTPPRGEQDRLIMTDEMEAIDEATQYRRKIDHSLARFSAAHDDAVAEETKRRERLERFTSRPVALLEQTRTALQRVVAPGTGEKPDERADEQQAEKTPQTRLQEKKQRNLARSARIGRIVLIVLSALVLLGTGIAWGAVNWFDAKFTQVAALDENSADILNADAQANDENFLMVGSDTRDGAAAEEGVGTAGSTPGARSDTIMVAHVPADRKRVVVVSFPRDLEVDRPACNRWDTTKSTTTDEVSAEQKIAKLNTAYAVGGPPCVTKVIQKITGLRINHFVGIDFNGFKGMVDAVQGVTVHNERPIDDEVLGKVLLETGDVIISGDQALNYVRARHVKGDPTSDYGRIKRQQGFIGALLKKVMSSDVVLDPGKLSGFITAFAQATFGDNLGVQQMMTLAQSMRGLDPSKINFMTVPTVGLPNKRGNEVLVEAKTKSLFDALRDNTPLPDDKKAPGPSSTASGAAGGANAAKPADPAR